MNTNFSKRISISLCKYLKCYQQIQEKANATSWSYKIKSWEKWSNHHLQIQEKREYCSLTKMKTMYYYFKLHFTLNRKELVVLNYREYLLLLLLLRLRLLPDRKHDTAAVITDMAMQLKSSKMAEKRISWSCHIVETQKRTPSRITIK